MIGFFLYTLLQLLLCHLKKKISQNFLTANFLTNRQAFLNFTLIYKNYLDFLVTLNDTFFFFTYLQD